MKFIRDVITEGERHHAGELCFAVEARYSLMALLNGIHTRQRAEQMFSALRVWDTAENSGVLVYLQVAEHRIEIVADRGIAAKVPEAEWSALCAEFADRHAAHGPGPGRACLSGQNQRTADQAFSGR